MAALALTVGIPFRNEERHLGAAIRSILAQTFTDFELLLVDDGSSDHSLEIAQSFGDPRVRVLSDGTRRFLGARLNQIVREARADLIARMDGDDVSHPDRLRRQIDALEAAPRDCAAVGTWAGLIAEDEVPFAVVEAQVAGPRAAMTALEGGLMPHPTLLARRSWLEANPYDETLSRAEDGDLWRRTVATTSFTIVPEPLYALRVIVDDPTFLPDYVEGQRQHRMLLRRYGPATLGWVGTARALVRSGLKGAAMRAAVRAGMGPRLVRRRGRPPTEAERRLIEAALSAGSTGEPQAP